jgi:flagellar protein FliS
MRFRLRLLAVFCCNCRRTRLVVRYVTCNRIMSTYYYNAYLDAQVDSASPLQLIHLAYESAIAAVVDAREHLQHGRIHERARAITKATAILMELNGALDHKAAAGMSLQLANLYLYMMNRLREANFGQLAEPLIEVEGLLRTIGDSWRQLAATDSEAGRLPVVSGLPEQSAWIQPSQPVSFYLLAYNR